GNTVRLWDVSTRQEVATFTGHSWDVTSVAFSPDGSLLASGSGDDTVKLWDVSTRQEMTTLIGHSSTVTSVAFSPDGSLLASGSWDRTILLWKVTLPPPINQPPVASFAYSPESPATNRDLTFDASSSSDPDGQIVSYEWDFGDGITASDVDVSHSYHKADVYTVTLTITDDKGDVSTKSANIPISLYLGGDISVPLSGPPTLDFANANDSKRAEM
ncbi:PKD domain-containing protein, partial [Candidatus Poribacteria bacterium]